MNSTLAYYAQHARDFFDNTFDKAMDSAYCKFLPLLPADALILDAGCGSGRDSLYFLSEGYRVEAFDASEEMAALASRHIGREVRCHTFEALESDETYDAVWAAASLLHLPYASLPAAITHLSGALKPEGLLYASFKYGVDEYTKEGRHFTSLDEMRAETLFRRIEGLALFDVWLTDDPRQEREGEKWLNLLARKVIYDNG